MKQVIVTIRDDKNRLKGKVYYSSVDEYLYKATEYVQKNLGKGFGVELKAGANFKICKNQNDFDKDAREHKTSLKFEIDSWITLNANSVEKYLVK